MGDPLSSNRLQPFGPGIWTVDGPKVSIGTFGYCTRMAIVASKDDSGNTVGAWIWSPVCLTEELAQELEATIGGPVLHIVAPNKLHHLNLKHWSGRYPDARVYAPPGLKKRSVVKDVEFHRELDDQAVFEEGFEIDQVVFRNRYSMEEVVIFHKPSKTVLFCDLIQRYKQEDAQGWKGFKRRWDGMVEGSGGAPREWIWSFWFGIEKARIARKVVVEKWVPDRLLIAHGECVHTNAIECVSEALRWAE